MRVILFQQTHLNKGVKEFYKFDILKLLLKAFTEFRV